MRIRLFCALMAALIVSACASQPTPTATIPTATTAAPTAPEVTANVVVIPPPSATAAPSSTPAPTATLADPTQAAAQSTIQSVIVATMPPPGTLAVGSSSTSTASFNTLTFTQTGGNPRTVHTVMLKSDGTLTRDGATSTVSADVVAHVDDLIRKIDFFNINGQFTGPNASPSTYQYSLDVETKDAGRTIFAQDGMMPPELIALFTEISQLGTTPPS